MRSLPAAKPLLWILIVVPAAVILYRYSTSPDAWPGDMLQPTGEWSARLIILALCLTPLAQLLPGNPAVRWLIRHRRAFGVGAFAYSLLHLAFYVADMETLANMVAELGAPAIWTGWIALLCLVAPGVASNDAAMRALGRGWKRVQRLAYPAALLTLVHWLLIHDGRTAALLHFAPLALLQSLRLARSLKPTPQERTVA
jgi:sulfoxide reductase heme-binding subunit YedZ